MRILFYTQNRWAFGLIHHSLIKELYKYNIHANLLDWTKSYTEEEFFYLNNTYDIFVTHPEAVHILHNVYHVPLNKIVAVAHGEWDLFLAKQSFGTDFYESLYNFGVVSEALEKKAEQLGISARPSVVEIGIDADIYDCPISDKLEIIGYGGLKESKDHMGNEIKRGWMVDDALCDINVHVQFSDQYNYLCMPGYYRNIDCLVVSSSEESVGLPAMEAAAAGRLVLGTPVGYFEKHGKNGGGIVLPVEPFLFMEKLKEHVVYYANNPDEYKYRCLQIQKYAKENYSWETKVEGWINLFLKEG
jgi:glycosyltransferase involved in cell wall biosynthesis